MNPKLIESIANAVLYEGYMLYPYRPSAVKNRQRWNFGVVSPKDCGEAPVGTDSSVMQTECLAFGSADTEINVKARFLQPIARTIGEPTDAATVLPQDRDPDFRVVETLQVGEQILQTWQEVIEREILLPTCRLIDLSSLPLALPFAFPRTKQIEAVRGPHGRIAGFIVRKQEAIEGRVDLSAEWLTEGLCKINVRISNVARVGLSSERSREEALMRSMVSTHSFLSIGRGEFLSMLDPPAGLQQFVAGCRNIGTWPVLVGENGERDAMLSSPIILYDYPQIAPESPGDLFDATEIDEILALRILTLTDEEKREMRDADERGRQILERTEALPREHFMKLHGALRGMRPADEDKQ